MHAHPPTHPLTWNTLPSSRIRRSRTSTCCVSSSSVRELKLSGEEAVEATSSEGLRVVVVSWRGMLCRARGGGRRRRHPLTASGWWWCPGGVCSAGQGEVGGERGGGGQGGGGSSQASRTASARPVLTFCVLPHTHIPGCPVLSPHSPSHAHDPSPHTT